MTVRVLITETRPLLRLGIQATFAAAGIEVVERAGGRPDVVVGPAPPSPSGVPHVSAEPDDPPERLVAAVLEAARLPATRDRVSAALVRLRGEPPSPLTRREIEVLSLVARGWENTRVASELGVSANTVRNHLRSACAKLGVHNRTEAVSVAVRTGWITLG